MIGVRKVTIKTSDDQEYSLILDLTKCVFHAFLTQEEFQLLEKAVQEASR